MNGKTRPEQNPRRDREREKDRDDLLIGRNPIQEALTAGQAINKAWIVKSERTKEPLARLAQQIRELGAPVLEVERVALDRLAGTRTHQGIAAEVAAQPYLELDELLTRPTPNGQPPFLILLDGVNDGYNLGAILRIADAAGISGVVLPKRRSVSLDRFVAKASAGAIAHVPVARVTNLTQTILTLKEEGFWIAGADAQAPIPYTEADWSGKIALVVGGEGEGIADKRQRHLDLQVNIPQFGQVNSLNVAVATGILVFHAVANRHEA